MTSAKVSPARVPQEERTRVMRQRLLEATVDCLVEYGWSGTSTTLVSQRAGVSRGAQLHHFPTKDDLVLAAVEHLTERRGEELREAARHLPQGKRRTRAVLEMFADHFTSPVFTAALELWVAARTDADLRAALVPEQDRLFAAMRELYGGTMGEPFRSDPEAATLVEFTVDLLTGLSLASMLSSDRTAPESVVDRLVALVDRRE